ncbi:MAG TPA: hypothetical protein ENK57_25770 [Polyangiaceae bacterium]|nr:hypothetical protein [Polyangiaceae bacterium]
MRSITLSSLQKTTLALAALALSLGCNDATSVLVEVTSPDLAVPADIDALRFRVSSGAGHTTDQTFPISSDWPHSLALLPAPDDNTMLTVEVQGIKSGAVVVRRVLRTAFVSGQQRILTVSLSRACLGVMCPDGVDCVAGRCTAVPMDDAGVDAGGLDAGAVDAGGAMDAGPGDAGPGDAGTDAGSDAGFDAAFDAGVDGGPPAAIPLILSEYIEGSGNNKALEIYNRGTVSFDLSRCEIRRYSNGSTSAVPIPLTGTVAASGTFVICNSSIAVTTACDMTTGALNHNGDDALALHCDSGATPIDSFGTIGPPAMDWTGGGLSSRDYVLTRLCSVGSGDTNPNDAFDPSSEWTGRMWDGSMTAAANLSGLGNRSECP